ncbi:hypothetical protein CH372_13765 [Leptospira meyeri]|nr:hypothetical protein CH372_13765 [Leptospira meyeri]
MQIENIVNELNENGKLSQEKNGLVAQMRKLSNSHLSISKGLISKQKLQVYLAIRKRLQGMRLNIYKITHQQTNLPTIPKVLFAM